MSELVRMTPDIPKMPLVEAPTLGDPQLEEVGRAAEEVLGYRKIQSEAWELGRETAQKNRLAEEVNGMIDTLNRLGIMPFTVDSVIAYRESKEMHTVHPERRFSFQEVLTEDGENIIREEHVEWIAIPIYRFDGEIPLFVLDTAIKIKRADPTLNLYVDQLQARTVTERRNRWRNTADLRSDEWFDPFLVVSARQLHSDGGDIFHYDPWGQRSPTGPLRLTPGLGVQYVEVWDEPDYKEQRKA